MFNKKRKHTYLPYPTLKLDQLKALNVPTLTNPNCLLFMWTTNTHLPHALELAKHWGFSYSTIAFVWDNERTCPAHDTPSANCAFCLKREKCLAQGWTV